MHYKNRYIYIYIDIFIYLSFILIIYLNMESTLIPIYLLFILISRRLERRKYSYQKHTLPIKLRNLFILNFYLKSTLT